MEIALAVRSLLVLEALACLVLALASWRETSAQPLIFRIIGPLLWCAAAAIIAIAVGRA